MAGVSCVSVIVVLTRVSGPTWPSRLSVTVPLVAVSVTSTVVGIRIADRIALPLPLENTRSVSCGVVCAPGTVLTGASLVALMVTVAVATLLLPVPSLATKVITRAVSSEMSRVVVGDRAQHCW